MSETRMSRLTTVELFCKAAELCSFTAAAEWFGTTPSAVSKAVSRLERRLALKLFERTTRAVRLTDEGHAYFKCCQQALADIEGIEAELAAGRIEPRGKLRVTLPVSYGLKRVIPQLAQYSERYPDVSVEINLSNAIKDFVADGFDIAVRIGKIQDSRLIAIELPPARYRLVASPRYVDRYGRPARPDDLLGHRCIDLIIAGTGRPFAWQFSEGDGTRALKPKCQLLFDDPMAALAAAVGGAGIARLLDYTVADEIREGKLLEILGQSTQPLPQPIFAVYPYARHPSPKTRSFIAFLTELDGRGPVARR